MVVVARELFAVWNVVVVVVAGCRRVAVTTAPSSDAKLSGTKSPFPAHISSSSFALPSIFFSFFFLSFSFPPNSICVGRRKVMDNNASSTSLGSATLL